jgi:hypothetical protein
MGGKEPDKKRAGKTSKAHTRFKSGHESGANQFLEQGPDRNRVHPNPAGGEEKKGGRE